MIGREIVLAYAENGQPDNKAFSFRQKLVISTVFMTASEISSFWSSTSGGTSLEDLVSIFMSWGVSFIVPYISPGLGTNSISGNSNFSKYAGIIGGREKIGHIDGTVRYLSPGGDLSTIWSSNDGIIVHTGSYVEFRYGGRYAGDFYSGGYPNLLGYGQNSSNSLSCTLLFFSSDNRVVYVRLGYNKNNSDLNILGESFSTKVYNWYNGLEEADEDPYGEIPASEPSSSGGSYVFTGDDIDYAPLPAISASATGFLTMLNPTAYQIARLAEFMWSPLFDIDTLKRIFADPMDIILGVSIVPGPIVDTGVINLAVGGFNTGLSMVTCDQYYSVDCGTVTLQEVYGAYLDYYPYTKVDLFLPYIGSVTLDPNEVMGKTIGVKYNIDALTGSLIAMVKVGGSVLYNYSGSCATNVPVTTHDWTETINAIVGAATLVATSAMGLPIGAGVAPGLSGQALKAAQYREDVAEGNAAVNASGNILGSLNGSFQHSGNCGTAAGLMGIQKPYLTITIPNMCRPAFQNRLIGYPSYITEKLSTLSGTGYTKIEEIHLEGIPATSVELDELYSILKGGVIF